MDVDTDVEKEDIDSLCPVLYQDDDLVILNKPSGVLVHPGQGGVRGVRTLMEVARDLTGAWVYPLHRLDRPVSGPVLFLRHSHLVKKVQDSWHSEETEKIYLTLARRRFHGHGFFDFPLSEQPSKTEFWALGHGDFSTFCKVKIHTGRTHQIRRHFGRRLHNVVGDTAHGKGDINKLYRSHYNLQRIFLHCHQLSFPHPTKIDTQVSVKAALPHDLVNVLLKASCGHVDYLKPYLN